MNFDESYLVKVNKITYSIFFIFFLGYLATLQYRPYLFSYIVKIIPILSLSFIAFLNIDGIRGKLIVAGLLLSATGDVFLAISGKGYFIFGLSFFAAAHVVYILALFREPVLKRRRSIITVVFLLYGLIIGYFIVPNLQRLQIPVSIYIVLLILMGISAVAGRNNHYLVIVGAALFIISDSIIAFNMFLMKISNSSFWIMVTYYPAQFLITKGVLKTGENVNS